MDTDPLSQQLVLDDHSNTDPSFRPTKNSLPLRGEKDDGVRSTHQGATRPRLRTVVGGYVACVSRHWLTLREAVEQGCPIRTASHSKGPRPVKDVSNLLGSASV